MIDKTVVACRFRKSADTYDKQAVVQKWIANRLFALILDYTDETPERILEIGCGTGFLTRSLKQQWEDKQLFINDLVESICIKTASACRIPAAHCLPGDIETLDLPVLYDLIVSSSAFQWLTCPEQTYCRIANRLQPGKLLAFSSFGEDNFHELKSLTGNSLPYLSMHKQAELLAPYFDILYMEESRHALHFDDPLEVLQHIRQTGVNAVTVSQVWTKEKLKEFSRQYQEQFYLDGKYPLTYHPYYFIGRKK